MESLTYSKNFSFFVLIQFSWRSIPESLVKNNSLFTNSPIFNLKSPKLLHPHENQARMIGWHGWDSTYIITKVYDKKKAHAYKYALQLIT